MAQVKQVTKEGEVIPSWFTPSGEEMAPQYEKVYDEKLKRYVVKKVSEFNLYEFIQASSNATDLAILRERAIKLGEIPSVLDGYGEQDVDLSLFPSNIHELYELNRKIEDRFENLDSSAKEAFKSSSDFRDSIISGDTYSRIQAYYKAKAEAAAKAAQEGENK